MIRIGTSEELLEAFRSLDRDQVSVPSDFKFPLAIRDYLAWPEPSGHRVYVVFEDRARPRPLGLMFERGSQATDAAAQMCSWCHSVRSGNNVGLLTVKVTANRTIGLPLCRDLGCKDKVLGSPGVHDFHEDLTETQKVSRLIDRMNDFARRYLF